MSRELCCVKLDKTDPAFGALLCSEKLACFSLAVGSSLPECCKGLPIGVTDLGSDVTWGGMHTEGLVSAKETRAAGEKVC